jgi:hypothetical protein
MARGNHTWNSVYTGQTRKMDKDLAREVVSQSKVKWAINNFKPLK